MTIKNGCLLPRISEETLRFCFTSHPICCHGSLQSVRKLGSHLSFCRGSFYTQQGKACCRLPLPCPMWTMNHCEGYIKLSHKTVPLIVLSWRQLPEQTIFYKVVLYYSAFMLATGRINSIMSKWIFNYEEVI